MISARLSCAR